MGRVASDIFAFSDGDTGHVIDLGSAPDVGDTDILFILSETVMDSVSGGFGQQDSRVASQAAYWYDRVAVGGEGSTVTIDTNGSHPTVVWWERWDNLDAREDANSDIIGVTNSNATSLPDGSTGALSGEGRVVFVAAGLGNFDGADPTAPVWSDGYTAAEAGAVAANVVLFGGYKEDASASGEPTDVVTWTNNARNRDNGWSVYSTVAAGNPEGALAETAPAATESASGDVPAVGQLAETSPAATESAAGDVPVVGVLAETAPAATESLAGLLLPVGALVETAPAATESVTGTNTALTIRPLRAMATTTVTIYAPGSAPDEWTGERTGDTAVASGVPASIIEQARTVNDPRTGTPRLVRQVTGRVPDGTPIEPTSRVVDGESRVYAVSSVRQVRNPLWVGDVVLELIRTDQLSP